MITIGNSDLSDIKYGNQNITAVYAGDILIWPSNDDPASVIIGGGYRLPTIGEWQELISKSTTKVEKDSNNEYRATLTTPAGRILSIPLGDGNFPLYMSSNRLESRNNIESNYAISYYHGYSETQTLISSYGTVRYEGQYVRPVRERNGKPAEISQTVAYIDDPALSVMWCCENLSNDANNPVNATSLNESGKFAWGETSPKTSFSLENYKFYNNNQNIYTRYNNTDNLTILKNNVKFK